MSVVTEEALNVALISYHRTRPHEGAVVAMRSALAAVAPLIAAQERERIAATVDCDCAHKADVLAVRNENSGDRWRACGRDPCGALQARAIRQEPGHE